MKALPSQEYLRSRIEYNPETGEARWKEVDSSYGLRWKVFNSKTAGNLLPLRIGLKGSTFSKAKILYKLHYNTDVKRIRFVNKDSSDYSAANLADASDLDAKLKIKSVSTQKTYKSIDPKLSTLLNYDHRSGHLRWNERQDKSWDTRFANRIAGSVGRSGYRELKIKGLEGYDSYMCHRVAWYLYYGEDPVNYQIDHIDGNRTNNKILNLRLATNSLNTQAKVKSRRFSCRSKNNKFYSNFSYCGNNIYLGDFSTREEAQQAYDAAVLKYKPIYEFTEEEQRVLDELYNTYPRAATKLQQAAHELQVKAVQWYETGMRVSHS